MTSPEQNPKLPMWIFFVSDAVLIIAAWFIAAYSARPLSTGATFAIFACIFGGALILLVPLIARFERQKNNALDERQRELEALARTVSASAEQISIAATGLHQIADLTQKNLRHAEQLPQKLQEKVAEFEARFANVSDTEKEELEKELESLRSSESEKLETLATKIAKSVADLTKLEATTHQHLSAASEAIAKLSFGTASAIGKAQVAAEQALGQARIEAARAFGEASGNASKAVEAAKAAALAEIDGRLAGAKPTPLPLKPETPAPQAKEDPSSPGSAGNQPVGTARDIVAEIATPTLPPGESRPEPSAPPPEAKAAVAVTMADSVAIDAPEPQPILAGRITEVAPVAPHTADPFPTRLDPEASSPATPASEDHPNGSAAVASPKVARKRAAKKPAVDALVLDIEDSAPVEPVSTDGPPEPVERVITSDGATRLIVTAYIGIGNRLFIRGEGPGLSWEKGVPLQFISIGKWRWETNEASAPVHFKLYKNDDLECAALGAQSLDAGHQHEVSAAF